MTTITLPADTVRYYNDGPVVPDTPLLLEAEHAYRNAFADAAAEVVRWGMMRDDLIEQAWCLRQQIREQAEVPVSSADLYGVPELDSEQIVYRCGHEINASHIRGRVQGLEIARRCWDEHYEVGTPVEAILVAIFIPWSDRVAEWARSDIDPTTVLTPPRPEDGLTEDHMRLLDFVRDRVIQPGPSISAGCGSRDQAFPIALFNRATFRERKSASSFSPRSGSDVFRFPGSATTPQESGEWHG